MKKILLLLYLVVTFSSVYAQKITNDTTIHFITDEMPLFSCEDEIQDKDAQYACSQKDMFLFIYSQINYPKVAREQNISGTVMVSFIVEKDGIISNVKIMRPVEGGCNEEVIRVIKLMPKWKPGVHKDEIVRVQFTIPITFASEEKRIIEEKINTTKITIKHNFKGLSHTGMEEDVDFLGLVPLFSEDCRTKNENQRDCSNAMLMTYIYNNIKYPKKLVKTKTEGVVVVSFDVSPNGTIENIKIIKGIGKGSGKAVIKVIQKMPFWDIVISEKFEVTTTYTVPILFSLKEAEKK